MGSAEIGASLRKVGVVDQFWAGPALLGPSQLSHLRGSCVVGRCSRDTCAAVHVCRVCCAGIVIVPPTQFAQNTAWRVALINVAPIGSNSDHFGLRPSRLLEWWSNLAKLGPAPGQVHTELVHIGSTSADVGQILPSPGHARPKSDQVRPKSFQHDRIRPSLGKHKRKDADARCKCAVCDADVDVDVDADGDDV